MKRLGRVVSIHDDKLVVQLEVEKKPKIGDKVFDDKRNFIGHILEYFGSVKNPAAIVSCRKDPGRYLNKEVFY